jgi:hypothetical protein
MARKREPLFFCPDASNNTDRAAQDWLARSKFDPPWRLNPYPTLDIQPFR